LPLSANGMPDQARRCSRRGCTDCRTKSACVSRTTREN
jgi:hypothetical protein